MQRLEVSGAVRPLYWSLGVKGLTQTRFPKNSFVVTSYNICTVTDQCHAFQNDYDSHINPDKYIFQSFFF